MARLLDWIPQYPNRRICMLMITHACNLNCRYCYEKYKSNSFMTLQMAKACINKELENLRKEGSYFREIAIEFMGGEPFLNFGLIRNVVEWMESLHLPFEWLSSSSTNGTLFSDERRQWMKLHREHFIPCLSFDGTTEMQEANRGEANLIREIPFLTENWPMQEIHMTVSKRTLSMLRDGVLLLQGFGARTSVALAQGEAWEYADAVTLLDQIRSLGKYYLDHPMEKPTTFLCRPLYEVGEDGDEQTKFCGAGTNMVAYDIDGATYPCHMFTPLVCGDASAKYKNGISPCCGYTDPFCKQCDVRHWCTTCCGFNNNQRGGVAMRDHRWCDMMFAEAIGLCEFQLSYYDQHSKEITEEDALAVNAAVKAYEVLKCSQMAQRLLK